MQSTNHTAVQEGPEGGQKRDRRRRGEKDPTQKPQHSAIEVAVKSDWGENSHLPNRSIGRLKESSKPIQSIHKWEVKNFKKIFRKVVKKNFYSFWRLHSISYCTWIMKALRCFLPYCDDEGVTVPTTVRWWQRHYCFHTVLGHYNAMYSAAPLRRKEK